MEELGDKAKVVVSLSVPETTCITGYNEFDFFSENKKTDPVMGDEFQDTITE